jgi:hypothetical protein
MKSKLVLALSSLSIVVALSGMAEAHGWFGGGDGFHGGFREFHGGSFRYGFGRFGFGGYGYDCWIPGPYGLVLGVAY